jgi:cytolysin-activating lysine-acyltransferase
MFGRKSGSAEDTEKSEQLNAQLPPENAETQAEDASTNGVAVNAEDAKKRMIASKQMAAAFGELTALLMRSPTDKHHSLADLEWLVVPAIARGQYALAEAQSKETGATAPVGAVLWALVSEDVDKRLSDLSAPTRLKPDEWRSGDIPWIIHATGDAKILGGLIQQLTQKAFKDRQPKMRVRGADGKVSVGHLEVKQKADANA